MRIGPTLSFLTALFRANLRAAWSMRTAFWMQVFFMVGNNLLWFSAWWILFTRFPDVGGWHLRDFALLQGELTAAFGVSVVLAYGVRDLALSIDHGDLDPILAQPKPPLLHALVSRTSVSGFGDMLTSVVLLSLAGVAWRDVPLVLGMVVCGAVAFTSAAVLFHASAFWLGPVQPIAAAMREWLVLFSGYPETLFVGGMRGFLFTAMPAAFVAWVPTEVIRSFSWTALATAIGGALGLAVLASLVFRAGVRRYVSGSRFTVRA